MIKIELVRIHNIVNDYLFCGRCGLKHTKVIDLEKGTFELDGEVYLQRYRCIHCNEYRYSTKIITDDGVSKAILTID